MYAFRIKVSYRYAIILGLGFCSLTRASATSHTKMSRDVKGCQVMSRDVKRCQAMSRDVKRCVMSHNFCTAHAPFD